MQVVIQKEKKEKNPAKEVWKQNESQGRKHIRNVTDRKLEKLNDGLSDSEAIALLINKMCTMPTGRYNVLMTLTKRTGVNFQYNEQEWLK